MKKNVVKILKIVFTTLFVLELAATIYFLCTQYSDDGLFLTILAGTLFLFHLFSWIAPKKLFDLCWRMGKYFPDSCDYDTGLSKLGSVGLGILVCALILLTIGLLIILL